LCFNPQYRGRLTTVKSGRDINERLFGSIFASDFVIPKIKYKESLDPFAKGDHTENKEITMNKTEDKE